MALELNLTKNTNEQLEGTLGKYYARVEYKGTIGIKELAAHMHQHNTAFSKGIVMGVLGDMVDCVLDGYTVKIDDLGIFKASVDANGLTLEPGAKISAGRGSQRTDEELQANPAAQQFAVGDVKLIMQATGNTTIEKMNADAKLSFTSKTKAEVKRLTGTDAKLSFTSKTKAEVKRLTGSEATEESNAGNGTTNGGGSSNTNPTNGGGTNGGGTNTGGGTGTVTPSNGDNTGGGDNGGDGGDPGDVN